MSFFQNFLTTPWERNYTGQKVIGSYSLFLFWPDFFLGAVITLLKIGWMTYSRFCVFLQMRKHSSDERSNGISGFARRKTVGDHGRGPWAPWS